MKLKKEIMFLLSIFFLLHLENIFLFSNIYHNAPNRVVYAGDYSNIQLNKKTHPHHSPIDIDGNSEFTAENGVINGSGTLESPYIIAGWNINELGEKGVGIKILNTDAHFVIENVIVRDGDERGGRVGILLKSVNNGIIRNVDIKNVSFSIKLSQSSFNKILNNTCMYAWDGIYIGYLSNNNTIISNKISYISQTGIAIQNSNYNKVINNNSSKNGNIKELDGGKGISIWENSRYNYVAKNTFSHNYGVGIFIHYKSPYNEIVLNDISYNIYTGILCSQSNTKIYWNNIIGHNTQYSGTEGTKITWTAEGKGNYWTYYDGKDIDNDGIGDTLLPHLGVDPQPLMNPIEIPEEGFEFPQHTLISSGSESNDKPVLLDTQPQELWSSLFGGSKHDYGDSVVQTSDGGYIIAGRTDSFGSGEDDVYLVKTDSKGNLIWNRTYGGTNNDWGHSVHQTSDGGYILAGRTESFGAGDYDAYTIKTDSDGNMIWNRTYGGTSDDSSSSIYSTSDGGYILAGSTKSFGSGDLDVYLVKTDSDGKMLWNKTYGGAEYDSGKSVIQVSDKGYLLVGLTYSYRNDRSDVYMVRTASDGNVLWERTFGGLNSDVGRSIQQTLDGGYIIVGYTRSLGARNSDVYLVKISPESEPEPEPEEEPKTSGGIPGFGYESVLIGVVLSMLVIWLMSRQIVST